VAVLTPEGLRAIVERDRRDREYIARVLAPQEPSPRDAALEAELGPLPDVASVVGPTRAEQDRANLLALLRAVAAVDWTAYRRCLTCLFTERLGHIQRLRRRHIMPMNQITCNCSVKYIITNAHTHAGE
jgi:hypothetical protein